MDLDATPPTLPQAAMCSICQEPAVERDGARSIALLHCGHKFHLGPSIRLHWIAFNVKGIMQCPNCRNIEESNWLIANRLQASTDSSYSGFGNGVTRGAYEVVSQAEPRARTSDPTADESNVLVFDGTEPIRNSEIEQRYLGSIPLVDIISTTPFVIEVPGYDGSNQWRSTQSTPRSVSSSVAPFGSSPAGQGTASSGHNQAYTSVPSRSPGEQRSSVFRSENGSQYPPPDRMHPF